MASSPEHVETDAAKFIKDHHHSIDRASAKQKLPSIPVVKSLFCVTQEEPIAYNQEMQPPRIKASYLLMNSNKVSGVYILPSNVSLAQTLMR